MCSGRLEEIARLPGLPAETIPGRLAEGLTHHARGQVGSIGGVRARAKSKTSITCGQGGLEPHLWRKVEASNMPKCLLHSEIKVGQCGGAMLLGGSAGEVGHP